MQECSQAFKICKCLWSLSCGGVSNILLLLSITFHFYHYIWGFMCSTGPFQLRWFKGYIHSSCYYHHQIGSINLIHCYHIFPWLCAWDICYIIYCHLLHIHSGKTGILFSLLLCSLWWVQIKLPVRYTLSSLWVRLNILSAIHYTIYGAVCFQFTISLVMIECTLCVIIIIESEVWTIIHCLGLGHETMVYTVCLSIFLLRQVMANSLKIAGWE